MPERQTSAAGPPASTITPTTPPATGLLDLGRRFTIAGDDVFDAFSWERRDAIIEDASGGVVFERRGVEVPAGWSQRATDVVASKYFRLRPDGVEDSSVRQLVGRVVDLVAEWGREGGYFASPGAVDAFRDELAHLVLSQRASFNSPVWFNVGIEPSPQCSACFINSVEDTMEAILGLARTEGMLFKYGSGSGCNLSTLRGSMEALSNGGVASGPVSFMRGLDAFAGAIKSGGKTRRAAKMVLLDVGHPDVVQFIRSKQLEEEKAKALIDAGYDPGFDVAGGAYDSIDFQNANHSVRLPDEFMQAVEAGGEWVTRAVTDGRVIDTLDAREVLRLMAEAAWACGDPGVQFDTTINRWHTCPQSGRIDASNPCSEFIFLDDTACNLASLNLLRFWDEDDGFAAEDFRHACEVMITAQEILVDNAGYPNEKIAERSRRFRPLGLGYTNLGALLTVNGLPYDSAEGRSYAAAVTALMTGSAYCQSARLAAVRGPFAAYPENRGAVLEVLDSHREAAAVVDPEGDHAPILEAARRAWEQAVIEATEHGVRNSQATALAPTGTISLMMDCDTTGVEPEIALVRYKRLVGGGVLKMVSWCVPTALRRLGYDDEAISAISEWVEEHGTVEGAPGLADDDLAVFDCALRAEGGSRSIAPAGHLKMMAAVQPFVSGAISKTVNLPHEVTPDEFARLYRDAWKLGVKAIAVYRDGCKGSQPVSTTRGEAGRRPATAVRRRLPDERRAITHKFSIDEHEGYLTVGLYEDGQPGEIFLVMAKEGSTISGLMDAFATSVSIALQYGVPLKTLVDKFTHTRFEPSGFTRNREIPIAKSVTDYIFRWLASKFLTEDDQRAAGVIRREEEPAAVAEGNGDGRVAGHPGNGLYQQDSPPCHLCGAIMVRSGSCYRCLTCGSTTGCS